jgi:hypothetical protein
MNDIDKIKNRIKKLFMLSKSPNANEAALALEMAQKLMIEHGIKRSAVGEFEIIQEDIRGNGGRKPPRYENYLTANIATAFGCRSAYGYQGSSSNYYSYFGYTFVGLEHRVQIASFIAEVILRKLKRARSEYMGKLTRVRLKTNKIKRADDFCLGWAATVIDKLTLFANTDEEERAIENYVDNLKWGDNLKTISRGAVKRSGINDYAKGRRAAEDVQIQHGVEGNSQGSLLLEA